jgi:hypothetical protein
MMGKANLQRRPEVFVSTLQRFWNEGAWLMPTGGDNGKRPLLGFSKNSRHPFELVMRRLEQANSQTYGIRLKGLVVLDIDVDDENLIYEIHRRFGRTDCIVKTGRGFHLYYSTSEKVNLSLRGEGLNIDVKQGLNEFVLGPHSLRPDGVLYKFHREPFLLCDVSPIKQDKKLIFATAASAKNKAQTGTRHDFLKLKASEYIEHVDSKEELLQKLLYDRDRYCDEPISVPDAEVDGIANWWWNIRLNNKIYSKNNSVFSIPRQAYQQIRALPNGLIALDLYLYLSDKHGHIFGKKFQINVDALKASAGFAFGQKALHKAIKQLIELGYLTVFKSYHVGKHGRIFQLSKPNNVV